MRAKVPYYLAAVVLIAVLGAAVGCSNKPDDAKISSDIQASLNGDSGLQGKQISVQSANGTVTLGGSVDNEAQRDAAARYAAAAPGVKQVVNNLQIGAAPAPVESAQAPPAPAEEPTPAPARSRPAKPSPSRHRHHQAASSSSVEDSPAPMASQPAPMQEAQMQPPPNPTYVPPAAPVPPPPPQKVTIPSGTTLAVRLVDTIDSEVSQQGQTFKATLNSPLAVEGEVAIPAGYDVEGHIVAVQSAGKFAGKSLLTLQLDRIAVGGKYYNIETDQYHREGTSRGKNTAEKVGAGAAIGAIIGGIAGGGKGAAIGAAAGGGIGGGVQAATKGQQIKLPSETVLNFTLQSSVTVLPTTRSPHEDRPKLERSDNSQ
jgi:hypothetical protein